MASFKKPRSNARLAALNNFLVQHRFALDGEGGIGGEGHTAVWDKRGETPTLVQGSAALVEDYRCDKAQSPKTFLALIDAYDKENLAALVTRIRSYAVDLSRNSWSVGDGINVLANYYPADNAKLSERLKLGLSPARIGQLRNTAKFFPQELRDDAIAFEAYNEARTRNASPANKEKKLDAAKLARLVKANPSVDAVKQALPSKSRESLLSHDLRLIVSMTEVNGKPVYKGKVLIDGKDSRLRHSATLPDGWRQPWTAELIAKAITALTLTARSIGLNSTDPAPAAPVIHSDEGGTTPEVQAEDVAAIQPIDE